MADDVSHVLSGIMARNRGPDPLDPEIRQQPNYGVAASLDGNVLSMVLTFRRGSAYCCYDWGCHLDLYNKKQWKKLREALALNGVSAPAQLLFKLSCVIEEGAIFFNMLRPDPVRKCWYEFEAVPAHHYEASTHEAST
jgi:hypothetical protein